jgi:ADP-ribosylglycohydrolase/predicted enzyme related to lactoylglutathione lyase
MEFYMTEKILLNLKNSKAIGAFLGAAFGDALGWPNERIGRSKPTNKKQTSLHEFKTWNRRSGGRYSPYQETIEAGEYSDDTQLILCLSRSLLRGDCWLDYFTQVELPLWTVYERGGGGATKKAANAWLDSLPPWSPKRKGHDLQRYFNAGGNGVAMRVLPHVIYLNEEKDFKKIAINIFNDGISTHGHPKALLGALAYGYALWISLHMDSKLGYGQLINDLIQQVGIWSEIPQKSLIPENWFTQAESVMNSYLDVWEAVKQELLEYLKLSQSEMEKGALTSDDDVLRNLNCFDSQISGAGTVAAISSIYLASRHAADPINGVVKAAYAIGIDTDTIASMTGGLLGCIDGADWLSNIKANIQDASCLEKMAKELLANRNIDSSCNNFVGRHSLKKWMEELAQVPCQEIIPLSDGRTASVTILPTYIAKSGKYKVDPKKLIIDDGQSIYINKTTKGNFLNETNNKQVPFIPSCASSSLSMGAKIPVTSLENSTLFYRDVLGLTIKKQLEDTVVFQQGLVLTTLDYLSQFTNQGGFRSLLYIEVSDIEKKYQWLIDNQFEIVTPIEHWKQRSRRRYFRCIDPDGNYVEIFEK